MKIGTLYYEARRNGYKGDCKTTREDTDRHKSDEAKEGKQRAQAVSRARTIWNAAQPLSGDHPYVTRKRIKPVSTLREIPVTEAQTILGDVPKLNGEPLIGRLIIVPVKVNDRLSTLELIDEEGRKKALPGGAKGGVVDCLLT